MSKQALCKAIDSIQPAGEPSPSVCVRLGPEYAQLVEAYENWQTPGNDPMIYILEHEYTEESFGVKSLKGADRAKVEALHELAKTHDLKLYLGDIEKSVSGLANERHVGYGNTEHWLTDVMEEELSLTEIINKEGVIIGTNMHISEDQIMQDEPFNRYPDEEDYGSEYGDDQLVSEQRKIGIRITQDYANRLRL